MKINNKKRSMGEIDLSLLLVIICYLLDRLFWSIWNK